MSKNLIARILVAIIAIPIIIWISYKGGHWLYYMILLFAVLGMGEFLFHEGFKPSHPIFWIAILTLFIIFSMCLTSGIQVKLGLRDLFGYEGGGWLAFPVVIVFYILTAVFFALGKDSPYELFSRHSRLMWGFLYITMLYPFVFYLGEDADNLTDGLVNGGDVLLFLFASLWIGDTAAMGVGKWLGKHKLAPGVSPNKTVEGFLGHLVFCIVMAVIFYFWKFNNLAFWHLIIISIGISFFGQVGDLVESMWKRSVGIKDSSSLIPGHGGVLDRFDSLLFAAPFVFFYLSFI